MTIVTWMSIKNVVKEIAREVKVLKSDKGHYNIRIYKETAAESAYAVTSQKTRSPTMVTLRITN